MKEAARRGSEQTVANFKAEKKTSQKILTTTELKSKTRN